MKVKIYSLVAAGVLMGFGASAQTFQDIKANPTQPNSETKTVKRHYKSTTAKGGNILFYEDFANGLAGNTPFGAWTVAGPDSAIWEHDFDGSSGQYSTTIDTLLSASSSNGWMMFDGDGSNPGPPSGFQNREGYLISPVIDLTGSPNIHMEFDHRFRFCCSYEFRLRVSVTTDGFATSTDIIVSDPWQRNETPPNPVSMRFSITEALQGGDLSNVQFRFEWEGLDTDPNGQGTSHYWWMIDDVTLRETLPNDMVLTQAAHADYAGTGELEYSVFSYNQLRPVTFKGWVLNDGVNDQTGVEMSIDAVGANSNHAGTSPTITVPSLGTDTVLGTTTFTPQAMVDTFNIMYSLSQDSIDMKPNNNDTVGVFSVSEHVMARDLGDIEMSYTGGADQGEAFELCTGFDITADAMLYSIDAVFTPAGNVDIITDATIYDFNLDYLDESVIEYEITADDTSSFDGPPSWFHMVLQNPVQLFSGETYYACVRHFGGDTLAIGMSGRAPTQTCFVYQTSTSTWFYVANTPMIRLNFDQSIGIEETANTAISRLTAQPNPFTNQTTIMFDLMEANDVSFTLTDVSGRIVRDEQLGKLSVGPQQLILDGTNMEDGVYFYTIHTSKGAMTERLVLQR